MSVIKFGIAMRTANNVSTPAKNFPPRRPLIRNAHIASNNGIPVHNKPSASPLPIPLVKLPWPDISAIRCAHQRGMKADNAKYTATSANSTAMAAKIRPRHLAQMDSFSATFVSPLRAIPKRLFQQN
ncbi:Uncharacterised protein [Mycobacteroides abscessus subsp. abscessus]|nr:Uncharacterised protein [Mycobacteroides abscessus subsp. abscessus]